ncbi:MAG: hypothetical protein AAF587_39060 [Bacteroidota bacterium]
MQTNRFSEFPPIARDIESKMPFRFWVEWQQGILAIQKDLQLDKQEVEEYLEEKARESYEKLLAKMTSSLA